MTKPKLTYFDNPASRGEECRLALVVAGVDFEDNRLKRNDWAALKPKTPFGHLPVLEIDGRELGESNAILVYIGRHWGLHPKDDFEAARHEAILEHAEELRHSFGPSLRMTDDAERKRAREVIAAELPAWAEAIERQIGDGPFFAGAKINVVDVKLNLMVRWLTGGKIDHVPTTIIQGYPKLMRLHDAVRDHAAVTAWYAKTK